MISVVRAPADEVDERVAGDLVGEAGAAVALDAALAVELDERPTAGSASPSGASPRRSGVSPGPKRERLVLQRALAALVAHRAVEGVVDEQELEDAVLRLLHRRRVGDDLLALGHRDEAGGLQLRAAGPVDLDEAHAAHADRPHARVVAEAGDVGAGPLGGGDDHLARLGLDGLAVDGDRHDVVGSASAATSVMTGTARPRCGRGTRRGTSRARR